MKTMFVAIVGLLLLGASLTHAGPLDPDCTVEKGVKSAAAKATIGVGGRCKPAEVASDTAKRAVGIDDEKRKDEDGGLVKKAGKKLVDGTTTPPDPWSSSSRARSRP